MIYEIPTRVEEVDNAGVDDLVDRARIDLISHIKGEYSERRCTDVQQLLSTLRVGAFSVTELVEVTDSSR